LGKVLLRLIALFAAQFASTYLAWIIFLYFFPLVSYESSGFWASGTPVFFGTPVLLNLLVGTLFGRFSKDGFKTKTLAITGGVYMTIWILFWLAVNSFLMFDVISDLAISLGHPLIPLVIPLDFFGGPRDIALTSILLYFALALLYFTAFILGTFAGDKIRQKQKD